MTLLYILIWLVLSKFGKTDCYVMEEGGCVLIAKQNCALGLGYEKARGVKVRFLDKLSRERENWLRGSVSLKRPNEWKSFQRDN